MGTQFTERGKVIQLVLTLTDYWEDFCDDTLEELENVVGLLVGNRQHKS